MHQSPAPDRTADLFRPKVLSVPLCAQCRAPMTVDRCEPHFKGASLVATYRCLACGLRDRVQI
jgi:hypothetical protein